MTNDTNRIVRVYAFWGLAKRNYKDLLNVCRQHKNDSARFVFMDGDVGRFLKINKFYLEILGDNIFDTTYKKLSPTEVLELKHEFGIK